MQLLGDRMAYITCFIFLNIAFIIFNIKYILNKIQVIFGATKYNDYKSQSKWGC